MKTPFLAIFVGAWVTTLAFSFWLGKSSVPAPSGTASDVRTTGKANTAPSATTTSSGASVALTSTPWKPIDKDPSISESSSSALSKLRLALDNPNSLDRGADMLAALKGLDSAGLRQAADLLKERDDGMGSRWQNMMLMYAWGRIDPEAALAYNNENDNRRANFSVLGAWAEVDPDAAIAYAATEGAKNGDGENWSMLGVVHGLVKADPGKASQAVELMPYGRARGQALDMVLDKLWISDISQAQQWVSSIDDARLRNGATARVANRLANENLTAAKNWANTLADPNDQMNAMATIMENVAKKDTEEVNSWLNTLPSSPEADGSREKVANSIREKDPMTAILWAASMSEAERRNKTITRVAKEWLEKKPNEAREALADVENLPQSVIDLMKK